MVYAAGGGKRLVGAVEYSDYPAAAREIPLVGSASRLDLERILALQPDIVIGWHSGNPPALLEKLRSLDIKVFVSYPRQLNDIAIELEIYGQIFGSQEIANASANIFRQRLHQLGKRFAFLPTVPVFYQIWHQPLSTIGSKQITNDVIRLCGGQNIFSHLATAAPQVSLESVLKANPEVIIGSGSSTSMAGEDRRPPWLDEWRRWPALIAVQRDNLFHINPDLLFRPTPRLLDGTEQLCKQLQIARSRRP